MASWSKLPRRHRVEGLPTSNVLENERQDKEMGDNIEGFHAKESSHLCNLCKNIFYLL